MIPNVNDHHHLSRLLGIHQMRSLLCFPAQTSVTFVYDPLFLDHYMVHHAVLSYFVNHSLRRLHVISFILSFARLLVLQCVGQCLV